MPSDLQKRSELLAWAEARLPYGPGGFDHKEATPVGIVRDGALVAACVYFNRTGASIEAALAAETPRWAHPKVLAALLAWPFVALGVRRITAIIPARNKRSQRLARGAGFTCEGKLADFCADDDALVFGLTCEAFERSRWRLMVEPATTALAA